MKINNFTFIFVILGFLIANLIFTHAFWHELIFDNSKVGARYGEVFVAEWAMDKVYQNIISGRNPFSSTNSVLYPFGTDFTVTDSGNGFYFLLLRPFFSEHQSLSVIVASGLFFASLGMYLFLLKMGFSQLIAFLIGLSYGYTTFLMPRMGQLNYTSIYVFPWFYLCVYFLLFSKDSKFKVLGALGTAIFFIMTLWLNLYFFVLLCLSIFFFIAFSALFTRKSLASIFKVNWRYLLLTIFLAGLLLYPWFQVLYQTYLFEGSPKTIGWGGAIQFSADLFSFLVPSIYSYFLKPAAGFIGANFQFATGIFENFSYPGLVILVSYFAFIVLIVKKKLPQKLVFKILPFFLVSLAFFVLTLGPFLHIFGRWGITLDEGIRLVVPLPFAVFHYLPLMDNIRVPGRLIIAFIFFAYIVVAFLLSHFLKDKTQKFKAVFLVIFILVFFFDQYFQITTPPARFQPFKAYEVIKEDSAQVSVMEIPNVVRDGFTYFGDMSSLDFIAGQVKHGKPVLGGYLGRVPDFKKDYYYRNPFLGYIGRLIDENIKNNGAVNREDLVNWQTIDLEKSVATIDFLDLKYILLDETKPYATTISKILSNLKFEEKMKDGNFSLWVRDPSKKEFLSVEVGSEDDDLFLGAGWNTKDNGFRWAWRSTSVMFKVQTPRKFNLKFQVAAFYKEQETTIYLNKKKVGQVKIPTELTEFNLPINQEFVKGINFIHFVFSSAHRPSEVIPESLDRRQLSAKFTKISLTEVK